MGVNSLPKPVTWQRRDCDLNPGPNLSATTSELWSGCGESVKTIYFLTAFGVDAYRDDRFGTGFDRIRTGFATPEPNSAVPLRHPLDRRRVPDGVLYSREDVPQLGRRVGDQRDPSRAPSTT